jgi:hypothetical protein
LAETSPGRTTTPPSSDRTRHARANQVRLGGALDLIFSLPQTSEYLSNEIPKVAILRLSANRQFSRRALDPQSVNAIIKQRAMLQVGAGIRCQMKEFCARARVWEGGCPER